MDVVMCTAMISGEAAYIHARGLPVHHVFGHVMVLIIEAESPRGKEKSGIGENRKGAGPPEEHKMENSSESHVDLDSQLLLALLTGVNREFPFVSSTEADNIPLRSKHQFFSDWFIQITLM
ncbi:CCAAT-binding factor [Euphorbia peplus]|nr:CCAAT-binding factor [Euphorbia peplus]